MSEKECIERGAAYTFFKDQLEEETGAYSKGRNAGLRVAMSAVMNKDAIPAADVQPVVFCRDCKCYQQSHYIDNHMECSRSGFPVHSVDFCSFGEKREES